MNQKSGQNSLGLDLCFEDEANPVDLFKKWFALAEKSEINDPNAFSVATTSKDGIPSVRMVLLKGLNDKGFVFYTNFNSRKGNDLKYNPNASICFHWKSLRRQVRVTGKVTVVENEEADKYFSSRKYGSKISAWASSQSEQMKSRDEFLNKIKEYEKKYPKEKVVPRPPHWSGWRVLPNEIEFWLELDNRSHQRLVYKKENGKWIREMLYP
ncbi:MAG: pyridoxamine 5'-phosphate oxidase [Pelagibacteraceae bacterium TMED247]|nr:pyridoxamine 5'-phosphate oxidase [Candidatus Pelagibacter sp.]RPG05487.1 MAG: pyridoxamine 5'-phosphate oxidase [Pelagibacteraceae bacterium TMED247]